MHRAPQLVRYGHVRAERHVVEELEEIGELSSTTSGQARSRSETADRLVSSIRAWLPLPLARMHSTRRVKIGRYAIPCDTSLWEISRTSWRAPYAEVSIVFRWCR